jgi:hypothetical protein
MEGLVLGALLKLELQELGEGVKDCYLVHH